MRWRNAGSSISGLPFSRISRAISLATLHPLLRLAEPRDAGALVAEQEFRDVPALFSSPTRFSTGTRTSSKNTSFR